MMSTSQTLTPDARNQLRERIERTLDEKIRPGLLADGGDVEVVGVDEDAIVQIRMVGSCSGCSSTSMTLVFGIEAGLKESIPEIRFLEAVP